MPKMKKGDWKGRYVRLLQATTNRGGEVFEEGALFEVIRYHGTLRLRRAVICPTCRRRNHWSGITGVHESSVQLLPPEYQPPLFESGNSVVWRQNQHSKRTVLMLRVTERKDEHQDAFKYTVIDPKTEQVYRDVDPAELSWT